MKLNKFVCLTFLSFLFMNGLISQSIEVISFVNNPVEINPLVGGSITVNYSYSSETGSSGNNIYIGLEILDSNNSYQSTIKEATLTNQQGGSNIQNSVEFFISSSNKLTSDLPAGHYYQVKAILYASGGWEEIASAGHWNTPSLSLQDTSGIVFSTNSISKGADISWMTEMESNGFEWKDNSGITRELLPLLNEYQLDAVRLRVWVDPSVSGANGWCDINDFVNKAKLADSENLDIMVCIHYSDWWADPSKQNKPSAWANLTVAQLETAVENHTTDILTALSAEGITPKWVQIGNETNDGMLWTTGKASMGGFSNYAKFLNAGSNAVKTYNSAIKTIIHIANGNDNSLFRWNIDGLLSNGFIFNRFDIIGMSLYPNETNWLYMVDDTYDNMIDLKTRYDKDVMMAEVGFSNSSSDISYQFLTYMIEKTKQANGLGVFYWEPIAHNNWKSYSKGAWDQDGSPSEAMDAFIDSNTLNTESFEFTEHALFTVFPNPSFETIKIKFANINSVHVEIYTISGEIIKKIPFYLNKQPINISYLSKGIYFLKINGKFQKFFKI